MQELDNTLLDVGEDVRAAAFSKTGSANASGRRGSEDEDEEGDGTPLSNGAIASFRRKYGTKRRYQYHMVDQRAGTGTVMTVVRL